MTYWLKKRKETLFSFALISERKKFSPEFIFSETVRGWIRWHSCSLSHPDDVLGTIKKTQPKIPTAWLTVFLQAKSGTTYLILTKGSWRFWSWVIQGHRTKGPDGIFVCVCVCIAWRWQTIFYQLTKLALVLKASYFQISGFTAFCACGYLLFSQLVVISSVRHGFTGFSVTFM